MENRPFDFSYANCKFHCKYFGLLWVKQGSVCVKLFKRKFHRLVALAFFVQTSEFHSNVFGEFTS